MLVLAQVHVQARGEVAADHAIGDVEADRRRIGGRRHQFRGEQVGLHRAGLVDQVHAWLGRPRHAGRDRHRRRRPFTLPVAELRVQQRHDLGQGGVADHDQGGVLRAHPVAVEVDQILALQGRDRRLGADAAERHRVGMTDAVQQRRQHPHRHAVGLGLLLADAGDPAGADPFDLVRREARPPQHVRVQRQRRRQVLLQRRQVGIAAVQRSAGRQRRPQCLGRIGERQRIALAGAIVEHAHGEVGRPRLAPLVGAVAALELVAELHHRYLVAFGQDHRGAVLQRRALQRRERQFRKLGGLGRAGAAVDHAGQGAVLGIDRRRIQRRRLHRRLLGLRHTFARLHQQGVVALAQPFAADGGEIARAGVGDGRQRGTEAAGVAGIHRALGQHVGLAAEAADALDATDEAGAEGGLGARQFGLVRPLVQQPAQFLVDRRLDPGRVHALLDHGDDAEAGAELRRPDRGADHIHQLVLVDQAPVQPRRGGAAQHLRQQLQAVDVLGAGLRHVPDAIDPRLRHLVGHGLAGGLAALGHVDLGLGHARAGRDVAEVARHLLLGRGHVDVAGQHQHRVVGTVPGAEPLLHVGQRGRVEVVHRADDGVVVRVAGRIQRATQPAPGLPVRLVFALALLVLHHPALLVQRRLIDGAEQVAHAVRLHPQRHVQRGGRHVLEVIGAVAVGGAVLVGDADLLERLEELAVVVLAALEHQVLEQMREPGAPGRLVLGADVVPEVDRHDRRLAIGVHHHPQPIGQGELLVGDIHRRGGSRPGRRRRRRVAQCAERDGQGDGQQGATRAGRDGHADSFFLGASETAGERRSYRAYRTARSPPLSLTPFCNGVTSDPSAGRLPPPTAPRCPRPAYASARVSARGHITQENSLSKTEAWNWHAVCLHILKRKSPRH
ncbi:hypothetical protein NB717_002593 [Xanthomonas sacchari]|nr:hypothetical protein [Xanthomonas sacchari]